MWFRGMTIAAWLAYLAGCGLILHSTLIDYLPGGARLFILEKGAIGESALWRGSLYVHLTGGLLCLFSALPQLSRAVVRRWPSVHKFSGRIYGASVLVLVAPTGFHLALFAKGGVLGKLGFLTLAVAAFHTTLQGWRFALPRHRDLSAHRAWMIRSFAYASSAVTFRIFHIAGYFAGLEPDTNYVLCLWLSLLGNAAVAELILRQRRQTVSLPIQLQTES